MKLIPGTHSIEVYLLLSLVLAGCSFFSAIDPVKRDGAPSKKLKDCDIQNAVPRVEPRSRYGNPATYTVRGKTYRVLDSGEGFRERGVASWYGTAFHGNPTSSGERYDMYAMTAAHKHLPLPSYVEVRNLENGRRVIVKVNDRGPFISGRIIDLSYAAATKIGMLGSGTAKVEIAVLDPETFDFGEWSGDERCGQHSTVTTTSRSFPAVGASRLPTAVERPRQSVESETESIDSITQPDSGTDSAVGTPQVSTETPVDPEFKQAYLQLATYSSKDAANTELLRLNRALLGTQWAYSGGLYPFFKPGAKDPWYRLRLGPIESMGRARELASDAFFERYGKVFPVLD